MVPDILPTWSQLEILSMGQTKFETNADMLASSCKVAPGPAADNNETIKMPLTTRTVRSHNHGQNVNMSVSMLSCKLQIGVCCDHRGTCMLRLSLIYDDCNLLIYANSVVFRFNSEPMNSDLYLRACAVQQNCGLVSDKGHSLQTTLAGRNCILDDHIMVTLPRHHLLMLTPKIFSLSLEEISVQQLYTPLLQAAA